MTGFRAFVRNYSDPCLPANVCTQLMDDIGSGAETLDEMKSNLQKLSACIKRQGLKFSAEKRHFGMSQISFLGNTITPQGITPEKKIKNFLENIKIPLTVKQVKKQRFHTVFLQLHSEIKFETPAFL